MGSLLNREIDGQVETCEWILLHTLDHGSCEFHAPGSDKTETLVDGGDSGPKNKGENFGQPGFCHRTYTGQWGGCSNLMTIGYATFRLFYFFLIKGYIFSSGFFSDVLTAFPFLRVHTMKRHRHNG